MAELLLPAGNIEKMKYAIRYGADAVYLGVSDFSLRSNKSGDVITISNINNAIETAHAMGAKAFVTLNIFARNDDLNKLDELLEKLKDSNPNALIMGDLGIFRKVKKSLPNIPIHISTQANTLNADAVGFWADMGAERVILARELSLDELTEIREKNPEVELETLVHGSICMSYSGRCLLSDYMTGRAANKGECTQPCRWKYHLVEATRPGEYMEINEDERGIHILNPKDLCQIRYIKDLMGIGINSFKIEGRTKSMYYAASVAKAYREAIDLIIKNQTPDYDKLESELKMAGNRGFSSGFLLDKPDESHYNYISNKSETKADFLGVVIGFENNTLKIKAKNQFKRGEILNFMLPKAQYQLEILEITNEKNEPLEVVNTNQEVYLRVDTKLTNDVEYGILRRLKQE